MGVVKTKRERPTLKAISSLGAENVRLRNHLSEVLERNTRLREQLDEVTRQASELHTERRIAEERLEEVQTHLSDVRVLLGLPDPRAVDMLKYLRTELAMKVAGRS